MTKLNPAGDPSFTRIPSQERVISVSALHALEMDKALLVFVSFARALHQTELLPDNSLAL